MGGRGSIAAVAIHDPAVRREFPIIRTCAFAVSHRIGKLFGPTAGDPRKRMSKAGVIGVAHLVVAIALARVLTGSFVSARAFALVEPAANAVAHCFFERWWHRPAARAIALRPAALAR